MGQLASSMLFFFIIIVPKAITIIRDLLLKKLSSGPEIYFQQCSLRLLLGEEHTDVTHTRTKEMEKTLLSHSCPISNILQPQRQAGHWPYQSQPDDGGQLTESPSSLTTSDNCLSTGAQRTAPEHVLLCDWKGQHKITLWWRLSAKSLTQPSRESVSIPSSLTPFSQAGWEILFPVPNLNS